MSSLETVVLRSIEEVQSIALDWESLLARSKGDEVFCTPDWMATWWEVFGRGAKDGEGTRTLFVICVRQGRTLVGLAPFVLRDRPCLGVAHVRRLEFMGTGEDEADEVCSDFLDIIAAPEYREAVCEAVWERMLAERPAWDEVSFRNVLESSSLIRHLKPMARDEGRASEISVNGERFHVDLSGGDFNAYVEGLSKKRKKRIFYYRRRLEKEGGICEYRLKEKTEIPNFLRQIARLNRLRRKLQGMPSAFESAKFRSFHEQLADRFWDRGWLDLRLWMKEGRAVAALYNFVYAGTIYYYQSGFDTEAFGNISPGLVTLTQVIEWGFEKKHRRFDFLVGAGGSYKEDYACLTESAYDLTLYNDTVAGTLLRSARGLRGLVRAVRARTEAVSPPSGTEKPAAAAPSDAPSDVGDDPDPRAA